MAHYEIHDSQTCVFLDKSNAYEHTNTCSADDQDSHIFSFFHWGKKCAMCINYDNLYFYLIVNAQVDWLVADEKRLQAKRLSTKFILYHGYCK